MPFSLPTDTQHLQLETRQYELFNRPLGQGIVRRRLYVGVAVCVVWFTVLLVAGVNPLSRLGPALFIVPPFAVVYLGTRAGDDGRMVVMRWYDALLARTSSRRKRIRNPLLASASEEPVPLRMDGQMTELHPHTGLGTDTGSYPGSDSGLLRPLVGRRSGRTVRRTQLAGRETGHEWERQ